MASADRKGDTPGESDSTALENQELGDQWLSVITCCSEEIPKMIAPQKFKFMIILANQNELVIVMFLYCLYKKPTNENKIKTTKLTK